ncbi:MAG: hypothetical protein V1904_03440, partial [Bacteroidota bacterium]
MKKYIPLFLIAFLQINFTSIKAQTYHPFPTDSAQWSVRHTIGSPWSQFSYQYKMEGDTVINGITYHKIYYSLDLYYGSPNETLHCFLREDTTKKVFLKYPTSSGVDTTEFMLYNFNLNVGDTVTIKLFYPTDSLFKLIVVHIDSTLLLTGYRRFIGLGALTLMWDGGCDNSIAWVEGMGCTYSQLYNEIPQGGCWEQGYDLTCFWEKGVYV